MQQKAGTQGAAGEQLGNRDMDAMVRVMACGQEIDRISRPQQMYEDQPVITYKGRFWPIVDGCVHLEAGEAISAYQASNAETWDLLVTQLLAAPLPTHRGECCELLRVCFRDRLPDGLIQAVSALVSLGLEREARELLVDFLSEKHDSERLKKLIQLQLLFNERAASRPQLSAVDTLLGDAESLTFASEMIIEDDAPSSWGWAPASEEQPPAVDDSVLREAAHSIQESIGTYRVQESGAEVPGLDDMPADLVWGDVLIPTAPESSDVSREGMLVKRTSSLGTVALDLLRYFVDNPGDKSFHAEQVLGYPRPVINGLLSGSLSHYLQRSEQGGWACQSWVPEVLATLDRAS